MFLLSVASAISFERFSIFDIGNDAQYFSDSEENSNRAIFQKVAQKSYIPMLSLLYDITQEVESFCFAISCSGVFLDQALEYEPIVISLLQKVLQTGKVEILAETYYHSLASLYSRSEFTKQVQLHTEKVKDLFGITPSVFRNTELVYSNAIAQMVADLGFKGMLTEGVPHYLQGREKTRVYYNLDLRLPVLLKHSELSDDIAFRFSDRNWHSFPLTAEKYLEWVEIYDEDHYVNLFMDFETFGEHQWADTGIFTFFRHFVKKFVERPWNHFKTPSQVIDEVVTSKTIEKDFKKKYTYDVHSPISWADVNRDLTAWIDNDFQRDTLHKVYAMENQILETKNDALLSDWRMLQTSDHFYYMCTKWSADGDVHAYFSPYKSPHEAYRRYSIVLADIYERLLTE